MAIHPLVRAVARELGLPRHYVRIRRSRWPVSSGQPEDATACFCLCVIWLAVEDWRTWLQYGKRWRPCEWNEPIAAYKSLRNELLVYFNSAAFQGHCDGAGLDADAVREANKIPRLTEAQFKRLQISEEKEDKIWALWARSL